MSQVHELNIISESWEVLKEHISFSDQRTAGSDLLAHLIDNSGYQISDILDSELMECSVMSKVVKEYTHDEQDDLDEDDYMDDYMDEDDEY